MPSTQGCRDFARDKTECLRGREGGVLEEASKENLLHNDPGPYIIYLRPLPPTWSTDEKAGALHTKSSFAPVSSTSSPPCDQGSQPKTSFLSIGKASLAMGRPLNLERLAAHFEAFLKVLKAMCSTLSHFINNPPPNTRPWQCYPSSTCIHKLGHQALLHRAQKVWKQSQARVDTSVLESRGSFLGKR